MEENIKVPQMLSGAANVIVIFNGMGDKHATQASPTKTMFRRGKKRSMICGEKSEIPVSVLSAVRYFLTMLVSEDQDHTRNHKSSPTQLMEIGLSSFIRGAKARSYPWSIQESMSNSKLNRHLQD